MYSESRRTIYVGCHEDDTSYNNDYYVKLPYGNIKSSECDHDMARCIQFWLKINLHI